MDFKLLGRRILSVALALVMAIPFIVLTPSVDVEAAQLAPPAFTGFAPGRHRVTVNGLSAQVSTWDATTRTMTVDITGTGSVANGELILYARAGTGPNTANVSGGFTGLGAGWLQTRDSGLMTQIVANPTGTVTLTFDDAGTFTNNNVRLYLGVRTNASAFVPGNTSFAVNGVTIAATHTPNPGVGSADLELVLSGTASETGSLRVWFTEDSSAVTQTDTDITIVNRPATGWGPWGGTPPVSTFELTEGGTTNETVSWTQGFMIPSATVIRVEFTPPPTFIPTPTEPGDFFYVIDFVNESVIFGNNFNVYTQIAELDPRNGRPIVDANGVPNIIDRVGGPLEEVNRLHIHTTFNRRADRITAARGNWQPTWNGIVDISRNVRRGGYLGVRWRNPVTQLDELIHLIRIDEQANHRDLRDYRAQIFLPSRMVGDVVEINNFIQNPSSPTGQNHTLEIRVGGDRGGVFNANRPQVATERLAPGARFYINHDIIPRGTRGTFRIAPQEPTNFLFAAPDTNADYVHIRDLARRPGQTQGWTFDGYNFVPVLLTDALAETGAFGSRLVRFRIPNQPLSPAVSRFAVLPGRNNGPLFVSRTNMHMQVLLGERNGAQVWARMPQNNATVAQIIGLFNVGTGTDTAPEPFTLPVRTVYTAAVGNPGDDNYVPAGSHVVHDFEFRFFRPNRVVSAPGIFTVRADQFDASLQAAVTEGAVIGSNAGTVVTATEATLVAAGYNIRIGTVGGQTNVANGAVVTDWFTNLPTGLVATVNQVQSGGSNIRINITGATTEPLPIQRNLEIIIPGSALEGSNDPLPVTNPQDGSPYALARINIAAYGGVALPVVQSVTAPTPVTLTFLQAEAAAAGFLPGAWGLSDEVALVTDPAGTYTADVVWDISGINFDDTATVAQTFIVPGTITFPATVDAGATPTAITVTLNVDAP